MSNVVAGFSPRSLFLKRRGPAELGLIYRNVCPYLAQHNRIASIEPRIRNAEGKLHAIDVAIIRVINLRGDAADWRIAKTQFAQEQAGLLIEKQRHQKPSGPGSLDNINHVSLAERDVLLQRRLAGRRRKIDNRRRRPTFHVRKNLFDLSRKRQLGIESSSIQIAANQLKLTYHVERCSHPTGRAIVGSDLVSAAGLFFEQDDGGALIRSFRDNFNCP